ncbi:MAG: hypothetical protein RIB59_00175 [Rhodospirillales bacterium]
MSGAGKGIVVAAAVSLFFIWGNTASASEGWQALHSRECGFAIEFPGKAAISKHKLKSGGMLWKYALVDRDTKIVYQVRCQDLGPRGAEAGFSDRALQKIHKNLVSKGNKILAKRKFSMGNAPGEEWSLVSSKGILLKLRMFFLKKQFYQVLIGYKKNQENNPDIMRHLNSFRFTPR